MSERKHSSTHAAELEQKLREVFTENREIFEELIVRGWTIDLNLPTFGFSGAYGYSPSGLSSHAGFHIHREVTPSTVVAIIDDQRGRREAFI